MLKIILTSLNQVLETLLAPTHTKTLSSHVLVLLADTVFIRVNLVEKPQAVAIVTLILQKHATKLYFLPIK